jgi:hypothetical protein
MSLHHKRSLATKVSNQLPRFLSDPEGGQVRCRFRSFQAKNHAPNAYRRPTILFRKLEKTFVAELPVPYGKRESGIAIWILPCVCQ